MIRGGLATVDNLVRVSSGEVRFFNPAAIVDAPKTIKQPMRIDAPRRRSIRPLSIMKPMETTAMTATLTASGPTRRS